jgi:hypothetical protein
MAQLTRAEMIEILGRNESVIYNGKVIKSVGDLPSEAELAKGDKTKEAAATQSLQEQKKEIERQLALLSESKDAEPKNQSRSRANTEEAKPKEELKA